MAAQNDQENTVALENGLAAPLQPLASTPRAKSDNGGGRRVLADKTPMGKDVRHGEGRTAVNNHSSSHLNGESRDAISRTDELSGSVKRPLPNSPAVVEGRRGNSPLKTVLSTPLQPHPALRDITNSAKTLQNPPEPFVVQPLQKRRSLRRTASSQPLQAVRNTSNAPATTKLTVVFPTGDEASQPEIREIEHAASLLPPSDNIAAIGKSIVIPDLDFDTNLDFSAFAREVGPVDEEMQTKLTIDSAMLHREARQIWELAAGTPSLDTSQTDESAAVTDASDAFAE